MKKQETTDIVYYIIFSVFIVIIVLLCVGLYTLKTNQDNLTTDYDTVCEERDNLSKENDELKNNIQDLTEQNSEYTDKIAELEAEAEIENGTGVDVFGECEMILSIYDKVNDERITVKVPTSQSFYDRYEVGDYITESFSFWYYVYNVNPNEWEIKVISKL